MTVSNQRSRVEETSSPEARRIVEEYARRRRDIPADRYSIDNPAHLFAHQQWHRDLLLTLKGSGLLPIGLRQILDVGCGNGHQLAAFEALGGHRAFMAGVDLLPERARATGIRLGPRCRPDGGVSDSGADIRVADASRLPWPDSTFDIVSQRMLFSSVLDAGMRREMAREMARVTRPDGVVLWYDAFRSNPWNPNLRGIPAREVAELFPGFSVKLRRVTLAAPLRRALVPRTWLGAAVAEKIPFLRTHLLGVLRRR